MKDEKNLGPKGERPSGPNRCNNRERNVGANGEEHSMNDKGFGGHEAGGTTGDR